MIKILKNKPNPLALAILLSAFNCFAQASKKGPWAPYFEPILLGKGLKAGTYGIEVLELNSGKLLFTDGSDIPLNPASSIKVLIAAAALSELGPNFRFQTFVSQSQSDICLIGHGDPSLVNETLWMLVEEAKRKGVQKIKGDLILDETFFPASRNHLTDFFQDEERAFTAPTSALSVNFNSLTIYIEPSTIGNPPKVMLDPELALFEIKNVAKTEKAKSIKNIQVSVEPKGDHFRVVVRGKINVNEERLTFYRAVPNPPLYTGYLFVEHFRRAGGVFLGKIRKNECPKDATILVKFRSKPLSQVIFDLNKFSNNFIAEMLVQALSANIAFKKNGLDLMKDWLLKSGIQAPELIIENGSGLSRKTRVSARTLALIVKSAATNFMIAPEYLASFGIGGIDGTLRRRFSNLGTEPRVRAKSGSLKAVVSLTGVADTPSHGQVVFSFIFNSPSHDNYSLQKLEERLIEQMMSPEIH